MEEYQFVQNPPKDFFCMICAKVLNEPHLTDCCGQHFCGVCLQQWFGQNQGRKVCPHCRSNSFSYIRDLPLKRKINALQVYCPFKVHGCGEIATVSEIESHKSVCGFAIVLCSQGCGTNIFRMNMAHHCDRKCPKRKIKCQYCGKVDYFDDITGIHRNTCTDYPVKCPRGCSEGNSIKRKDLVHHAEVCPLEQVPCSFSEAGCNAVVLRKDLEIHVESKWQEHLTILMTSHMEMKQKYKKLEMEHKELKEECSRLSSQVEMERKELKEECSRLSSQIKTLTVAEPIKLNDYNNNFTFRPSLSRGWVSPPFYVLDGYNFCFKHKSGNKVSLVLLRGECDDKLKWPLDLPYRLRLTLNFDKVENQTTSGQYWLKSGNACQDYSRMHFLLSGYSHNTAADADCRELTEQDLPSNVKEVLKYNFTVTLIRQKHSSCWQCKHCNTMISRLAEDFNGLQFCSMCGKKRE